MMQSSPTGFMVLTEIGDEAKYNQVKDRIFSRVNAHFGIGAHWFAGPPKRNMVTVLRSDAI